jgi:hypothetical protein
MEEKGKINKRKPNAKRYGQPRVNKRVVWRFLTTVQFLL